MRALSLKTTVPVDIEGPLRKYLQAKYPKVRYGAEMWFGTHGQNETPGPPSFTLPRRSFCGRKLMDPSSLGGHLTHDACVDILMCLLDIAECSECMQPLFHVLLLLHPRPFQFPSSHTLFILTYPLALFFPTSHHFCRRKPNVTM